MSLALKSMKRQAVHIKSVTLTYHTGRMSLAEGYEKIGPLHDRDIHEFALMRDVDVSNADERMSATGGAR